MKRKIKDILVKFFRLITYNLKPSNHKFIRAKNQQIISSLIKQVNETIDEQLNKAGNQI
jgi:hypothetical protein